jgi:hypothetical protein
LPRWCPCQNNEWYSFDHFGWVHLKDAVDLVAYRAGVEGFKARLTPYLADFRASGNADRALRKLIDRCHHERIRVVLLNLPEHTEFQQCYPPEFRSEWEAYFRRLSRELCVPFVDARSWIPDNDFLDGIHLTPPGAGRFTMLLAEQVIMPALATDPEAVGSNSVGK